MIRKPKADESHETGKSTLVPKWRFPEFRQAEGWKDNVLYEIADPVTERAVQGEADDVLSLSAEHGIVLQSEFFGKKVAGDNSERYLKIARDDFVYNDRTTKASTFGTIKRLSKHSSGIVSPIYKCFRFHDGENHVFWEWYFESGTHNLALAGLVNEGARSGRFNISISQFLSTHVWRPGESEQQKIAECLSSVDELIAAQARKVDSLKTHKKGLMQQLFPREGETQPRLRFPEFQNAGEWTKRKVHEVLAKESSSVEVDADQTYREIGVRSHGKGIFHKDPVRGSVLGEKRVFRVVKKALVLNIVFAWEQAVATTSEAEEGMIASHRFPMYVAKLGSCDVEFIKFAFLTPQGKHLLGLASPGGAGRNRTLGQKEFEQLEIVLPEKDEQYQIAECLNSIEALIDTETRKLETLKSHKKGLMQQLFPAADEVHS